MKRNTAVPRLNGSGLALVVLALLLSLPVGVQAQDSPPQRMIRTYIPPDQLVSFLPSTPFDQFVAFLNPIFERVTGKQIVDPESHSDPIGISISGMHFYDAFELVLDYNVLSYRETDKFFIVEPAVEPEVAVAAAGEVPTVATQGAAKSGSIPATLGSREIQINAVLFDLNLTKARDLGIDWNVFFGPNTSSGGQNGGNSGDDELRPRFFLKTDKIFGNLDDYIVAPDVIEFSKLTQLFRLLENEGVGETIANPQVTVQSGEKGSIQIGTDIPFNTRDFSGNTITQFLKTGIIVDVTPTMLAGPIADTVGSPLLDFIHLDVVVEKSTSQPTLAGPVVNRNTANTQVLLLDGEQTVIGGLYSTDELRTRRGIPVLKDLPGWFFGLRYLFGYEQMTVTQKELLIVLQARALDPLHVRAQRPFEENFLERHRDQVEQTLQRVDKNLKPDFPPRTGE